MITDELGDIDLEHLPREQLVQLVKILEDALIRIDRGSTVVIEDDWVDPNRPV